MTNWRNHLLLPLTLPVAVWANHLNYMNHSS